MQRARAELRNTEGHLARLEPLLPEKFVTEDKVDEARTRRVSAAMAAEQARTSVLAADAALDEARAKKKAAVATLAATRAQHLATEAALQQSKSERARAEDAVGQVANMNARIAAAEAAVRSAELDLQYTRVRAPFTGRVVNLNISTGAFARSGVEVFTLVDTSTWYVMANFRETQLRYIPGGGPGRSVSAVAIRGGTSVAPSSGSAGPCCPRTEPASMDCRASTAPSIGSGLPRGSRCASRSRTRTNPSASARRRLQPCTGRESA